MHAKSDIHNSSTNKPVVDTVTASDRPNDDGSDFILPIERDPGDGFRFAVGSRVGPKSSIYRIATARNTRDVYVITLAMERTLKISLHESGHAQLSILSNVAMSYVERNADRHLDRWEPVDIGGGYFRAYVITVPRTELRPVDYEGDAVAWAEDPGHGFWVNLNVVLAMPDRTHDLRWNDGIHLGQVRLVDDSYAIVFATRYRPSEDQLAGLARHRESAISNPAVPSRIAGMTSPAFELFYETADGGRGVTEVSLSIPPPGDCVICTRPLSQPLGSRPPFLLPPLRN